MQRATDFSAGVIVGILFALGMLVAAFWLLPDRSFEMERPLNSQPASQPVASAPYPRFGVAMVEVAPFQSVNVLSALALSLITETQAKAATRGMRVVEGGWK